MRSDRIRWAIAGTGRAAARMADTLAAVPDAALVAVSSASPERAAAFAAAHGIGRVHRHDSLADDDGVDVVYVATTNDRHRDDTLHHLAAGRHVVCEKPMALDAAQVTDMVEASVRHERFLMEGLWSRFLPASRRLVDLLDEHRIGEVRRVDATLGHAMAHRRPDRFRDPALGGGSFLDMGVYVVGLVHQVLGPPSRVAAVGVLGPTGVDDEVSAVLGWPDGALAAVSTSIRAELPCTARITGTGGWIDLPSSMHRPEGLVVGDPSGTERLDLACGPHPFSHQVHEVHESVRAGRTESATVPHRASLEIATVLDEVRRQVGARPVPG